MTTRNFLRLTPALVMVAATAGCAQLGNLGTLADILGGVGGAGAGQQGRLAAEVQQVDTRAQQIHVRTNDGRTGAVRYDAQTRVIYRQQQYQVTALERGDLVSMQVREVSQNTLYTDYIEVEQSVQDRTGHTGGAAQVQRFSGRVGQIDQSRGMFQLDMASAGTVTVSLPFNAQRATVDQFQRLRTGNNVTIDGVVIGTGRVELYQFR
jgi:hypothetical protein